MADWYVRHSGGGAIGPVAADLLVRGIAAGKVPIEAEVCEAGTDEWLPLEAIEEFQDALPEDGVQTRVIESPWFMEQTGRTQPGAATDAYAEDDDAATRVAPSPVDTGPAAPRPAAGAPSRPGGFPPLPPSRGLTPPVGRRPPAPPVSSPRGAARPVSSPRAAAPPKPVSSPRAAPKPVATANAAYEEDDDAMTRVARAPSEAAPLPAPRPAAGAPPQAFAPPPAAARPAAGAPPQAFAPAAAPPAAFSPSSAPQAPPDAPPAYAPMPPPPRPASGSLWPLILVIVLLLGALGVVLGLLLTRR